MTGRTEALLLVAPLAAYCALIFAISALSAPPAPDYPFALGDKLAHAAAYAVMLVLAVRAARVLPSGQSLRRRLVPAILFCLVYGATDELHQYFVPGRSCDVFDWVADGVGAVLAAWLLPRLARWRPIAALVATGA